MSQESIHIKVLHTIEQNGEVEYIRHEGQGQAVWMNESLYLRYVEQAGQQVTLKWQPRDQVLIVMRQEHNQMTRMEFAIGQPYDLAYATPNGRLLLSVATQDLLVEIDRQLSQGHLEWHYQLRHQGQDLGDYKVQVSFQAPTAK